MNFRTIVVSDGGRKFKNRNQPVGAAAEQGVHQELRGRDVAKSVVGLKDFAIRRMVLLAPPGGG
jgi:hypothetical protein